MNTIIRRRLLAALLAACALGLGAIPPAAAQEPQLTNGTYVMEGGSYMIEVQRGDSAVVVVEPNKRSTYGRVGPAEYHFWNPNTSTKYGIRVIDASTIEAFKPDNRNSAPTRLVLMSSGQVVENDDSDKFNAMAERYFAMAGSDPANAQSWTACAGVALKRAVSTSDEAGVYARQMASMLKQMDAHANPCPDAIEPSLWR